MKHLTWHAVCLAAAFFWLSAGTLHFIDPQWFEPIVPPIPGSANLGIYKWCNEASFRYWFYCTKLKKNHRTQERNFWCAFTPQMFMWIYDLKLGDGSSLTTEGHIIRFFMQVFGVLLSLWVWKFRT